MTDTTPAGFASLGLPFTILRTLEELGYEAPSPIQAAGIPPLLAGQDVLGMAQTGTGKTAAFALPLLARTQADHKTPQVLVLAPTRELAQQVSEAIKTYSRHVDGVNVTAIYGGTDYGMQLRDLKRGPQWVVGTPGRVMDHLRRGSLNLADIKAVVLDEADEMLRMGFIDDVNWILEHTPRTRQVALFSATMPKEIQRVAETHLKDPVQVKIQNKTTTNSNISQRYWFVNGAHKNDALLRIAEVEDFDAMMVFVRTKQATEEVAEFMQQHGFRCAPLNGDIPQQLREKAVEKLKAGRLDMIVATDVAARGLDVERISHVINYDIPQDTESYVHRIGRTGRAGREGAAIAFVRGREKRMLRDIERATRQQIEEMQLPTAKDVNAKRKSRFQERIMAAINPEKNTFYREMVESLQQEHEVDPLDLAAALAKLTQGDKPLFLDENEDLRARRDTREPRDRNDRNERSPRQQREPRKAAPDVRAKPLKGKPDVDMQRFWVGVGYDHGLKPGNLVGAIANEADLESAFIGHIEIFEQYSVVDLPDGMPEPAMAVLRKARVCGQALGIRPYRSELALAPSGAAPRRGRNDNRRGDAPRRDSRRPEGAARNSRPPRKSNSSQG
ncbi:MULTISPECIES: DEAD/DEAH box helicase [unclassified Oceanobacter]|jgi:ATP-dependent RNA helicase DeaD|uniref:DEAD/DEAH box helicase n=1 Tax=unclassified Oceanobacter TaxID=2620260 RepID=UPI0026E30482|nr:MULTISPECIES: DEAD/DEAH box helicase [unclassified Oceanobacter]MDO6683297.1 DEAD/DEAH box helicase [Oceanobacter sp. 5_MG-2023]MDP2546537.1 DEAD/DEAH box helicase [Oceanobacter sp. 4_MG-2023]MDP2610070.1 DEAD/DEAH box helicase [Oceanobacter sp. 1_MG-2023]MDP2613294.1 DEAD/DEAH box helicase [Oceanobacter sp. 2_MG-2023]